MKSYLLLILLCGLASAAPAFAGTYYMAGGSKDGTAFLVDTDTIKDLSPGKKSVQIVVINNGPSYINNIKYSINTTYFNCSEPAYAEPLRVFYDASGAVIRQLDHTKDAPYYRSILSQTLADAQLKAVCAADIAAIQAKSVHFDNVAGLVKSVDGYYASLRSGGGH